MKMIKVSDRFIWDFALCCGVVTLTAGILLPVVASSRHSADRMACAWNLKQLGVAFKLYAADNGGRLPLPGGSIWPSPTAFWRYETDMGEECGGLYPYVLNRTGGQSRSMWSCPQAVIQAPQHLGFGYGSAFAVNYIMNDYVRAGHSGQAQYDPNYPGYLLGMKVSDCPNPDALILLYEGVQDAPGFCSRHGSPFYMKTGIPVHAKFTHLKYPNIVQNYHDGESSFLFLDGHVKPMLPQSTISRQTYETSNVGHFPWWKSVYQGYGTTDLWNPGISGVNYP